MDKQPFRAGFPDRLKLAEQGTLIGIGQEQHELISPKPCERRWVGELLPRELCGFPQNHIPGGVSERTVDALDASTSMDASPLPRLFLHPAQPAGQHLTEVAAVSKGHKRITTGKLTQHTRVLLQAAEHDVEHGPQFRDFVMPLDGNGGFRFAFRAPVPGQRGFAGRRSPSSSRARSTPAR